MTKIRAAEAHDAGAILRIYSPYILSSAFTFEVTVPTLPEIQARIRDYSRLGWLVAEVDSEVVAYAYASPHRTREAYQWCCEVSVYVDDAHQRRGLARRLYTELFTMLKKKGYVNAYSGITLPNDKSVALHEALGFKPVGVYEKIGYKLGAWHDVGWWGLTLNPHPANPKIPT
jgi:L-amino acid N-acyltransferase YncA